MKGVFIYLMILTFSLTAGSKDNTDGPVPSWQQSESLNIQLGVRDRNSSMEYYDAVFRVTDENGRNEYEATVKVASDDWGFVHFPADFSVSALDGTYEWKCFVGDIQVSSGTFTLSADQRTITLPKK
ncbi:MAG TPA: hypothetical protein PKW56_01335 [Clostridiales bacterium]|nr:hypothetical protein [Clostridiales bacterium]